MICNSLSMSVRTTRELDVPSTEASGWSRATASRDTEAFTDRPSLHPRAMSFMRLRADLAASIRSDVKEAIPSRSEEHTSELQSQFHLVCRLLLEKKKKTSSHWKPTLPHPIAPLFMQSPS